MRVFAIILVTLTFAAWASAAEQSQGLRPTLRLVDADPFTLGGSRFKARERVRITADLNSGTVTRTVRTTRAGTFIASFGKAMDPCDLEAVRALGSRGSRATFRLPALLSERMCPIPPDQITVPDQPALPHDPAVPGSAALSLLGRDPVTLNGARFLPGESVQVTAILQGGQETQMTQAGQDGTFTVTFSGVSDPCSFEAEAVGSRGSTAAFRLSERMCQTD